MSIEKFRFTPEQKRIQADSMRDLYLAGRSWKQKNQDKKDDQLLREINKSLEYLKENPVPAPTVKRPGQVIRSHDSGMITPDPFWDNMGKPVDSYKDF